MSAGYRPVFPQVEGIPPAWKEYLRNLHDDLYPRMAPFTPALSGVTQNPGPDPVLPSNVLGSEVRQGRIWLVGVKIVGGSIAGPGAYLDLSFPVFVDTVFPVAIGAVVYPAEVAQNSNRLFLPAWTTAGSVVIFGVGGE